MKSSGDTHPGSRDPRGFPDVYDAVGKITDGSFDEDGVNVSFLKLLKKHVDVWHDFVK